MKTKNYFWILFVLLVTKNLLVNAQHTHSQDYFVIINKAELCFVDSNFSLALTNYRKAFVVREGFAKDYFNATICAILSHDTLTGSLYLNKLVSKGMLMDSLIEKPVINNFLSNKKWLDYIHKKQKNMPKKVQVTNYRLKKILDSLFNKDQYFRQLEGSYERYGDTIKKIDITNDKTLISIIDKFGYPNEDILGIKKNIPIIDSDFDIVIWHQTQRNFITNYSPILMKAAKEGRISPHRAAELIENQTGMPIYNMQLFFKVQCEEGCTDSTSKRIQNKLFYRILSDEKEHSIDLNRQSMGLETLSEYRKKVVFSMKDKRFFFPYTVSIPFFYFTKEGDLLRFIDPLKSINE